VSDLGIRRCWPIARRTPGAFFGQGGIDLGGSGRICCRALMALAVCREIRTAFRFTCRADADRYKSTELDRVWGWKWRRRLPDASLSAWPSLVGPQ